ncbi:UNVERIFIED_CONTAM: hypothetical protein GTU68_046408 [Idotea baltica]|nr:hypothetical protein [Idotea baltica]
MIVSETSLSGVLVIEPVVHGDKRGFFTETFSAQRYKEAGIPLDFVQDNHSRSQRGVLRGLHAQKQRPQGKLVRCSYGEVYDVAVDIDRNSETFGKYIGVTLSDTNCRQLYVPPGYLHGFLVISPVADFEYKCTDYYYPEDEIGVVWDDPDIAIDWPIKAPQISDKDAKLPRLNQIR